jgi:hypothetical protein
MGGLGSRTGLDRVPGMNDKLSLAVIPLNTRRFSEQGAV